MSREEAITMFKRMESRYHGELIMDEDLKIKSALNMAIKALEQQPCEDAISRDYLMNNFRICEGIKCCDCSFSKSETEICSIYEKIIDAPPVTTIRPKGEWIEQEKGMKVTTYKCSQCGRLVSNDTGYNVTKDYPFCHCGADMREVNDNEKDKD